MIKRILPVLVVVFILSGCAAGVKRAPNGTAEGHAWLTVDNPASSVSISLTDDAKKQVVNNLKFNQNEMLSYVKRALEARDLINSAADKPRTSLEVQVKKIRIRSNFSAVMWGFMAGSDSIAADIVLKDTENREIDRFEVSVSYALGGFAGGQDDTRMGWLYEKFAEVTLKEVMK